MFRSPALGRPLDWAYPSNRFILLATPLVGCIAGLAALVAGDGLGDAVGWGFSAGGAAFLGWAMTREVHPDRPWSAAIAVVVAPLGLLLGPVDLLATATVMLLARAVAGTTGRSLRPADLVLLGAVGGPVVWRATGPAVLGIGAVALVVVAVADRHRPLLAWVAAAAFGAGAVTSVFIVSPPFGFVAADAWLVAVGVAFGIAAIVGTGPMRSVEDRAGGAVLETRRVRTARMLSLLAVVLAAGVTEPAAMAPVWAALVATGVRPR